MSLNYANGLPIVNGYPMQDFPAPKLAKEQTTSENGAVSSVITLTQDTVQLEVTAVGGAAVLKWIATGDTQASVISAAGATANYDHVIPSGGLRRFVVPIESTPNPQSVQGANRLNGLYRRVAYKTTGVASIMVSEY